MVHVWFTWSACTTRDTRTVHLYAWRTRGARAGRMVCFYDTWCTCGLLVVLLGHVAQSHDTLVVTSYTFGSLDELTNKGCTCTCIVMHVRAFVELLVTCETLRELAVRWCTCGTLVCLYNTWCTYGSLVCLDDTWCTCGSLCIFV